MNINCRCFFKVLKNIFLKKIAHKKTVVERGRPAWHKIKAAFGQGVFNEYDELDRKALGDLIFDSVEKRKILNDITHPEIHRTMYKQIFLYLVAGHSFVVLDLPLLFETGVMLSLIHKIITVSWYV